MVVVVIVVRFGCFEHLTLFPFGSRLHFAIGRRRRISTRTTSPGIVGIVGSILQVPHVGSRSRRLRRRRTSPIPIPIPGTDSERLRLHRCGTAGESDVEDGRDGSSP